MKLPRRQFLYLAAGAAALPAVSRSARAQTYPTRPVRWIIGFPPAAEAMSSRVCWDNGCRNGSASHSSSRTGRERAPISLPRPSCVHHRTAIRCSKPAHRHAINATLYDKLNFNFIRDIAPVAGIIRSTYVMAVQPSFPAKTVREFIAYAKANPGKINMASAGNGTPQHLSGELFKMMAGVNMIHVPYRGDAPALTDLLAGQVQVCFSGLVSSIEYIRTGKVRALAVTTAKRLEMVPDIPTVGDFVPGYEASGW